MKNMKLLKICTLGKMLLVEQKRYDSNLGKTATKEISMSYVLGFDIYEVNISLS